MMEKFGIRVAEIEDETYQNMGCYEPEIEEI